MPSCQRNERSTVAESSAKSITAENMSIRAGIVSFILAELFNYLERIPQCWKFCTKHGIWLPSLFFFTRRLYDCGFQGSIGNVAGRECVSPKQQREPLSRAVQTALFLWAGSFRPDFRFPSFPQKLHHRLRARTHLQFFVDVVTMLAHRLNIHPEHVGDFLVGKPLGKQFQHFALAD